MRTIRLKRVDRPSAGEETPGVYGMDLTVMAAEYMPKEVFVKQRLTASSADDCFVAVASVAQMEDLPVNSPGADTSYFRTDSVSLVSTNPVVLNTIYTEVLEEIQMLISNLEALDTQAVPETICDITSLSVEVV